MVYRVVADLVLGHISLWLWDRHVAILKILCCGQEMSASSSCAMKLSGGCLLRYVYLHGRKLGSTVRILANCTHAFLEYCARHAGIFRENVVPNIHGAIKSDVPAPRPTCPRPVLAPPPDRRPASPFAMTETFMHPIEPHPGA